MIAQSARASPGLGTAARTRCTLRSVLVKVPSFSAKLAAGSTTSAYGGRLAEEDVLHDEEVEALRATRRTCV